jgi:hypothetical protein
MEVFFLNLDWAATTIGRMHMLRVTGIQVAKEAGITNSYLSAVLHDKKGDDKTKQRVDEAIDRLERKQTTEAEN